MDLAALDTTWLIAGLLALAVLAFGLALMGWRRSRRRRQQKALAGAPSRDPDLEALGLSEVRPRPVASPLPKRERDDEFRPRTMTPRAVEPADVQVEAADAAPEAAPPLPPDDEPDEALLEATHDPEDDDSEGPDSEGPDSEGPDSEGPDLELDPALEFDDAGVSAPRPVMRPASRPGRMSPHLAEASPLWRHAEPDAVGYLLESLWAALNAQSVALLRHDPASDTFAVEALVSRDPALQPEPFPARGNALRQVDGDGAITILEGDALGALRYHDHPRARVGYAAALALPEAPGVLLIADGGPDDASFSEAQLHRLGDYADLFGRLFRGFDAEDDEPDATAAPAPKAPAVRPRADIIAEEMAAARAHERPLALALVVPRDFDAIAAAGAEAVAEAEAQLFERLRAVEGSARVERFGEGMAGVFCHAGPAFVEAWAERVGAAGPPVSIGVALLRARHADPEALRTEAAAALHEAYQRGETCVILE